VEITESIIIPLSLFVHCDHVMCRWTRDLSLIVTAARNNIDVIGVVHVDQRHLLAASGIRLNEELIAVLGNCGPDSSTLKENKSRVLRGH
jgi:hypothetical protein